MTKEEIIDLWKKLNVTEIEFIFSCGGDSMGDTEIVINTDEGVIENDKLKSYFDYEVYNNVDFYVNSNGHYQGESGTVYITLENNDFVYNKTSVSEYYEVFSYEEEVKLTKEETDFLDKYVSEISGSEYGGETFFYKKDFILTDELEKIQKNIINKIKKSYDYSKFNIPNSCEPCPWDEEYRYRTENPIVIENNILKVEFDSGVIKYEDNY